MPLTVLTLGEKMPAWVEQGVETYTTRMRYPYELNFKELPLGKRPKNASPTALKNSSGEQLLAAIPTNAYVIALDERGSLYTSAELALQLQRWMTHGASLYFLIGGPEGLSESCLARAQQRWSLSPLTLPHPLVRVVLAEQLYRAMTLIQGHPYHRA